MSGIPKTKTKYVNPLLQQNYNRYHSGLMMKLRDLNALCMRKSMETKYACIYQYYGHTETVSVWVLENKQMPAHRIFDDSISAKKKWVEPLTELEYQKEVHAVNSAINKVEKAIEFLNALEP
jgi:hypothetical protein